MTHKLLLADDSVTIQRVVELTFSGEDVQVVTVGDGEQAIARIPVERPDIVLADIGMPKRSGYDVSAFVKGRPNLSHIPVLLLAGAFEPVDDARAQQVKCDGVLVKPFEPQQVVARVRELVEGARDRERAAIHATAEMKVPEPPVMRHVPVSAPEPIDDPFAALDAAFAGLGSKSDPPPPAPADIDDYRTDVPTLDKLLGSSPLRDATGTQGMSMPLPASTAASVLEVEPPSRAGDGVVQPEGGTNLILEAFHALLAKEQGEPVAPVRYSAPEPAPVKVTDELVDEVARRVIERLAPDTAKGLVKQVVSEVAERMIRDEIARIRAAVSSRR